MPCVSHPRHHITQVVCAVRTALRCVAYNGRSEVSILGEGPGRMVRGVRARSGSLDAVAAARFGARELCGAARARIDGSDGRTHGQCRRSHGEDARAVMATNRAGARANASGGRSRARRPHSPASLPSNARGSLDEAPRSAANRSSWPHVADPTTRIGRPRGGRYFIYRPPWTVDGIPSTPRGGRRGRDRRREPRRADLHRRCHIVRVHGDSDREFLEPWPNRARRRASYRRTAAWTDFPLPDGRARQMPLVFRACTGHGGHEAGWRRDPGP